MRGAARGRSSYRAVKAPGSCGRPPSFYFYVSSDRVLTRSTQESSPNRRCLAGPSCASVHSRCVHRPAYRRRSSAGSASGPVNPPAGRSTASASLSPPFATASLKTSRNVHGLREATSTIGFHNYFVQHANLEQSNGFPEFDKFIININNKNF